MAKVFPLSKAADFFRNALRKANILRANRIAGKRLSQLGKKRIESGKDVYGRKFIPNSKKTIRKKGSNRPLIDTGVMRRSYFSKIEDSGRTISIFNKKPYAIKHQLGVEVPPRIVYDAEIDAKVVLDVYSEIFKKV